MSNIIEIDFQGRGIAFTDGGWFNATVAAKRFGKRPVDWLRLPDTKRYLAALCRKAEVGKSHFVMATRGGDTSRQGTWLHPKLAVAFARWLDADFAVWCDDQIDELLRTGQRQAMTAWQQLQALQIEDASSFARASVGSRLMLERKHDLPRYRARRELLEREVAPQLFQLTH